MFQSDFQYLQFIYYGVIHQIKHKFFQGKKPLGRDIRQLRYPHFQLIRMNNCLTGVLHKTRRITQKYLNDKDKQVYFLVHKNLMECLFN